MVKYSKPRLGQQGGEDAHTSLGQGVENIGKQATRRTSKVGRHVLGALKMSQDAVNIGKQAAKIIPVGFFLHGLPQLPKSALLFLDAVGSEFDHKLPRKKNNVPVNWTQVMQAA
jgi:hypothetical protein